jgi:hypothetical protein
MLGSEIDDGMNDMRCPSDQKQKQNQAPEQTLIDPGKEMYSDKRPNHDRRQHFYIRMQISCVVRLAAVRIGTADKGTSQNSMIAPATAAEPKPIAPTTTEPRKTAKNMRRLRESNVELATPPARSKNGAATLPTMRDPCHLHGIACVIEVPISGKPEIGIHFS